MLLEAYSKAHTKWYQANIKSWTFSTVTSSADLILLPHNFAGPRPRHCLQSFPLCAPNKVEREC